MQPPDPTSLSLSTLCIHSDGAPDPASRAVVLPITTATTYQMTHGVASKYEYSRGGNPSRDAVEMSVAAIDRAKWCIAASSGLGALSTLIQSLSAGDHVLAMDDLYAGTRRYLDRVSSRLGIAVTFLDMSVSEGEALMLKALTPTTRMLYLEIPTNPMLKIPDVPMLIKAAKARDPAIITVVDNTFLSPMNATPLDWGADIVLHSATKYLNGHSDVVMGTLSGRRADIHERLRYLQNAIGAVPSPFDCYQLNRGLKTLALRIERHNHNAMRIAEYLESRIDAVDRVYYPGLPSHQNHALAKRLLLQGFGGIVSARLRGTKDRTLTFLSELKLFAFATSLGAVESLCQHPASMSHSSVPEHVKTQLGITDTLVRFSVGVEFIDDLIEDIRRGLDKVFAKDAGHGQQPIDM